MKIFIGANLCVGAWTTRRIAAVRTTGEQSVGAMTTSRIASVRSCAKFGNGDEFVSLACLSHQSQYSNQSATIPRYEAHHLT